MIWGLPLFQETTKWMFSRICLTERGLFDGFPLPSGQVTFECEEKRRKPLYFPSTTFKTYSNVFFLFSLTPISWIFEEGGVSPSIQKDKCAGQVIIIQLHDVKIQVGMAQPEIPRAYSWQTCANDIKCVWYPNFRVPGATETFHPQNPDVARWAKDSTRYDWVCSYDPGVMGLHGELWRGPCGKNNTSTYTRAQMFCSPQTDRRVFQIVGNSISIHSWTSSIAHGSKHSKPRLDGLDKIGDQLSCLHMLLIQIRHRLDDVSNPIYRSCFRSMKQFFFQPWFYHVTHATRPRWSW